MNFSVRLQKTDSNEWYIATNTKSYTLGEAKTEIVLMHYDQCGKISWSYRYGIDTASVTMTDMLTDNGRNIVMAGYYSYPDDYIYNAKSFIMKLSPNGELIWMKIFNHFGADYVYSIGQSSDGAYFIFSNHDNLGGATSFNAITKVSYGGNLLWYKHYADNPIWGAAIISTDGGTLIRSGNLIYKINANGNVIWANTYTNIRYTTKPIEVNGQYIFASYPSSADSLCFLFSLSQNGILNWISPGFKSSSINSLIRLSNGNLLATGSIRLTPSSVSKICLTELTINGLLIQQQTIDASPQQLATYTTDITEMDNQSLIVAGYERSGNKDSLILIKSRYFTDFSCSSIINSPSLPLPQISVSPASVNSIDEIIQETNPVITKKVFSPKMTLNCFIPDNNRINLGNDTTLCQYQTLTLKTGLGTNYQYLWSTGATTASITINQAGTYWVKAYRCDTIYDTIVVNYVTPLVLNYKISPLITNPYTKVIFENFCHPYSHLVWETGDGHSYTSDVFQHQYLNGGIYYPVLTITDNYGCIYNSQSKVIVDEVTFYIPNSFTPNGDGKNDVFMPESTGLESFEIFIYSRWGQEIFNSVNQAWDGKLNAKDEAIQGIYNYKIIIKDIFGKKSIRSGAITLIR